jgi:PAS domain
MQRASREAAVKAFDTLNIQGRNRILASYWLSLWRGDRMPARADFNPAKIGPLLPGIGIFAVKPGVSSGCRLVGTAITRAAGCDLTGLDWRQYTAKDEWQVRLERNSTIALGQIGIGVRSNRGESGQTEQSVELQLPFADEAEDGTRQILFHLDWRAPNYHPRPVSAAEGPRIADSFQAIALF